MTYSKNCYRYGREDEEVMGLKFCNEAIMCLSQLYPPYPDNDLVKSPLQVSKTTSVSAYLSHHRKFKK